jgi:AcrR family transcriptional regulator
VSSHSRRAPPLPPDARRATIIAAAIPLLRRHGTAVTTAQIAMAAGIAEGTLFRVFPDKESLIGAAIQIAFDPTPVDHQLTSIPRELGLRAKLVAAVEILQQRVEGIWQLMAMLGMTSPPGVNMLVPRAPSTDDTLRLIAALIEPHADELRCDPLRAARLLRMMTFAGTHPRISDGHILTAAEVVAVVLDGIRVRPELEAPDEPDERNERDARDEPGEAAEAPGESGPARSEPSTEEEVTC